MLRISTLKGLLAALLTTCTSAAAHAGPWLLEQGAGYAKLAVSQFNTDTYYRGAEATELSFTGTTLSFYGEIGLPGPVQAIVSVPFVFAANHSSNDVSFRNNGFGDATIAVEVSPIEHIPWVMGVQVAAPLYTLVSGRTLSAELGAEKNSFPELGDGTVDLTAYGSVGTSLPVVPGWLTASAGYRKRFGEFSDGVDLKMQLGVWLWENHVYLSAYSQALFNLEESADSPAKSKELISLEVSLGVTSAPFDEKLQWVIGYTTLLYTQYSAPGQALTAAVAWSWDAPITSAKR